MDKCWYTVLSSHSQPGATKTKLSLCMHDRCPINYDQQTESGINKFLLSRILSRKPEIQETEVLDIEGQMCSDV